MSEYPKRVRALHEEIDRLLLVLRKVRAMTALKPRNAAEAERCLLIISKMTDDALTPLASTGPGADQDPPG